MGIEVIFKGKNLLRLLEGLGAAMKISLISVIISNCSIASSKKPRSSEYTIPKFILAITNFGLYLIAFL